jgi:hypothetical protein
MEAKPNSAGGPTTVGVQQGDDPFVIPSVLFDPRCRRVIRNSTCAIPCYP